MGWFVKFIGYLVCALFIAGFLCFSAVRCFKNRSHFDLICNQEVASLGALLKMFPQSVLEIEKLAKTCKKDFKRRINQILLTNRSSRTFDTTFLAFDLACRKLGSVSALIEMLKYLSPDEEIREICRAKELCLGKVKIEYVYSKKLFKVLSEYNQDRLDGRVVERKLCHEEIYFIERLLESLKLEGMALDDEAFKRFKDLNKKELQLEIEFSKNIDQVCTKLQFNLDELKGVNEDLLNSLEKTEDGKIIVGLDYPTVFEIFDNCSVGKTRELVFKAFKTRAWPENDRVLADLVEARSKLADILNEKSYAHKDLKLMMVKSPERVNSFLDKILDLAKPKFAREFAKLSKELPDGVSLNENGEFNAWDLSFVNKTYRRRHFDLDENKIKEYFPLDQTITRLFDIYQNLLSLEFKIHRDVALWHEEAQVIEVFDKINKRLQGFVIIDLHPRPNKFSHACEIGIVNTIERNNRFYPAVCVVIANLPKETAGKPALLKLGDVRTFFHEFGHAMHHTLGTTKMDEFSGTGVLRDFVETPSTMFEEWLWEPEILKKLSGHYQTGESLPDQLIDKLIESRSFDQGHMFSRTVGLSKFSLDCYGPNTGTYDFPSLYNQIFAGVLPGVESKSQENMYASFGHLTGYGPKYYTYLWSMIFSADLFEHLLELGLDSPLAGQKVRALLSKGGSVRPEILLEEFLGRAPSIDALAKRTGLEDLS